MMRVQANTGHLATLRMVSPVTAEEFDEFAVDLLKVVRFIPDHVVFCSDFRGVNVFAPPIVERIVKGMRRDNPKIKRTALLLPASSAIMSLQIERIVREAGNPARRTFRAAHDAVAWLGEVLEQHERESLKVFVNEG